MVFTGNDEPDVVLKAHLDFIQAGAKVLSLNNYTATFPRLAKYGNPEQFYKTHELAYSIMLEAVKQANAGPQL